MSDSEQRGKQYENKYKACSVMLILLGLLLIACFVYVFCQACRPIHDDIARQTDKYDFNADYIGTIVINVVLLLALVYNSMKERIFMIEKIG